MFKKSIFILLAVAVFLLCACSPALSQSDDSAIAPTSAPTQKVILAAPNPTVTPVATTEQIEEAPSAKYIFFLIGDGMGVNHKQISEYYLQYISGDENAALRLNSMNVVASVTTYSANADITDSAASATALASGVKTNNGMIGMTPNEADTTSLLEALQEIGYATGIVTTTRITHATPACFYAHNTSRRNEADIAIELLGSDIDFIAGGGLKFFLPATLPEPFASFEPDVRNFEIISDRTDERFLLDEFAEKGYETFAGPGSSADLAAYSPTAGDKVFAPLTYNYFPYEIDRVHRFEGLLSLSEVTRQAIELLALDEDGFFLMVEGGRIDYAAHNNDIMGVIYDTLAFDEVVKAALDFYFEHPEQTLIITTSDHETGGLTLDDDIDYAARFDSVYDVSASYGDGFALLYNENVSFNEYISQLGAMGIYDLTDTELSKLKKRFIEAREFEYEQDEIDTEASLAVNGIINARLGIVWASDYHTSAKVDLGVTGIFEERFAQAKDNTDIANILADILQLDIGP